MKRNIAIIGSTGSIGCQALEVIRQHQALFSVEILTANQNWELLARQALEFQPNAVVLADESKYLLLKEALSATDIKVFAGEQAIADAVTFPSVQMVLTATVGYSGLLPTLRAIEAGKHIALANKETLVVAGALVTQKIAEHKVALLPVDSEHSAIFQCLTGESMAAVEKLILTASGGPFRGKKRKELEQVTPQQALRHPNWDMGAKITIDSASLMNKGLELIEAHWLFGISVAAIDVVIHPQSIVHSLVQFRDGSIKAQLGLPDMRLPIQYALAYPERLPADFPRFDFLKYPNLTFEEPDRETFRNLDLCCKAIEKGGNMPCILNAANEIAVAAFLKNGISFLQISEVIEESMVKTDFLPNPGLDDLIQTDLQARRTASAACNTLAATRLFNL